VADHRIGGVDRLVERQSGQARDGEPEQGGDHSVGRAFGKTFERRLGDARFVKRGCVAPDDCAHREAALGY
jgi:hypothetical protein